MEVYLTLTVYVLLAGGTVALMELGRYLGRLRGRSSRHEPESAVGTSLGGLLALLAFMLAFTFGLTSDRFSQRKSLVVQEANAISTAYLRADFLDAEHAPRVRALLQEYMRVRTDVRIFRSHDMKVLVEALAKSDALGDRLWKTVSSGEPGAASPPLYALLVVSINELLDTGEERRSVALVQRVPALVWCLLGSISVLTLLAQGYHTGISDHPRPLPTIALSLAIAAVYLLSIDMDFVDFGFMQVSQQPMLDTRDMMQRLAGS